MKKIIFILVSFLTFGCAEANLQGFEQVLNQTGVINSSQSSALFKFGSRVADGSRTLSDEEEYYLGRSVAATILSKYRPYQDRALTAYVNKIATALANLSDRPETFIGYHVMVLDTPEINAVSAPGGFIFLSKGFVKILPDEDALAAVIAHELAHVVKAHGVNAISEANLTNAFVLLGKDTAAAQTSGIANQLTSVFGDSVSDITNTLLVNGYSRSQEYEADEYAAELLKRAGYKTEALVTALTALEKAQKNGSTGGWMSTHPEAEDRIEEAEDFVSKSENPGYELRTARYSKVMLK